LGGEGGGDCGSGVGAAAGQQAEAAARALVRLRAAVRGEARGLLADLAAAAAAPVAVSTPGVAPAAGGEVSAGVARLRAARARAATLLRAGDAVLDETLPALGFALADTPDGEGRLERRRAPPAAAAAPVR